VNTGSFASIRFSVDNHPLTLIEADGTLLEPTQVSGVTTAVAQRYSVLLHANQTNVQNGTFWMRATLQDDMFTYNQPGQNLDIRGVIRCVTTILWSGCGHESLIVLPRYSDGAKTGAPGDPSSADPGPGISGLTNVDGTTTLVPLLPDLAPNATRAVSVTVSFQSTADGRFLGFMNTTSWDPLSGTTTLLSVQQNPTGYAAAGAGLGAGEQLIFTEDSIQVVDLRVVCVYLHATQAFPLIIHAQKDNLDDGDHPFHLHGHRPWMYGYNSGFLLGIRLLTFSCTAMNQNGHRSRALYKRRV